VICITPVDLKGLARPRRSGFDVIGSGFVQDYSMRPGASIRRRAIPGDAGRDGHGTGGRFARCHRPAKDPTRTQQSGKDDRRQAARFRFEPLFDPLSGAK
jgi:hypothetical protein